MKEILVQLHMLRDQVTMIHNQLVTITNYLEDEQRNNNTKPQETKPNTP